MRACLTILFAAGFASFMVGRVLFPILIATGVLQ